MRVAAARFIISDDVWEQRVRPLRAARLFLRLGRRQQVLLLEATAALAIARLRLAVSPFSWVARSLGRFSASPPEVTTEQQVAGAKLELVREIRWAVRLAARRVPFRAVCLPQAIAAHAMLRRRGIPAVLHLGATPGNDQPMSAHAWLHAEGLRVTGYPIAPDIVEIGSFT